MKNAHFLTTHPALVRLSTSKFGLFEEKIHPFLTKRDELFHFTKRQFVSLLVRKLHGQFEGVVGGDPEELDKVENLRSSGVPWRASEFTYPTKHTQSTSWHTVHIVAHSPHRGTQPTSWHTVHIVAHSPHRGTQSTSWHTVHIVAHSSHRSTQSTSWHTWRSFAWKNPAIKKTSRAIQCTHRTPDCWTQRKWQPRPESWTWWPSRSPAVRCLGPVCKENSMLP